MTQKKKAAEAAAAEAAAAKNGKNGQNGMNGRKAEQQEYATNGTEITDFATTPTDVTQIKDLTLDVLYIEGNESAFEKKAIFSHPDVPLYQRLGLQSPKHVDVLEMPNIIKNDECWGRLAQHVRLPRDWMILLRRRQQNKILTEIEQEALKVIKHVFEHSNANHSILVQVPRVWLKGYHVYNYILELNQDPEYGFDTTCIYDEDDEILQDEDCHKIFAHKHLPRLPAKQRRFFDLSLTEQLEYWINNMTVSPESKFSVISPQNYESFSLYRDFETCLSVHGMGNHIIKIPKVNLACPLDATSAKKYIDAVIAHLREDSDKWELFGSHFKKPEEWKFAAIDDVEKYYHRFHEPGPATVWSSDIVHTFPDSLTDQIQAEKNALSCGKALRAHKTPRMSYGNFYFVSDYEGPYNKFNCLNKFLIIVPDGGCPGAFGFIGTYLDLAEKRIMIGRAVCTAMPYWCPYEIGLDKDRSVCVTSCKRNVKSDVWMQNFTMAEKLKRLPPLIATGFGFIRFKGWRIQLMQNLIRLQDVIIMFAFAYNPFELCQLYKDRPAEELRHHHMVMLEMCIEFLMIVSMLARMGLLHRDIKPDNICIWLRYILQFLSMNVSYKSNMSNMSSVVDIDRLNHVQKAQVRLIDFDFVSHVNDTQNTVVKSVRADVPEIDRSRPRPCGKWTEYGKAYNTLYNGLNAFKFTQLEIILRNSDQAGQIDLRPHEKDLEALKTPLGICNRNFYSMIFSNIRCLSHIHPKLRNLEGVVRGLKNGLKMIMNKDNKFGRMMYDKNCKDLKLLSLDKICELTFEFGSKEKNDVELDNIKLLLERTPLYRDFQSVDNLKTFNEKAATSGGEGKK